MELALATSLSGDINSFALAPTPGFLAALLAELQALHGEVEELRDQRNQDRLEIQDLKTTVVRQDEELSDLRLELDALKIQQQTAQKRIASISDAQDEICDKIDEHAVALNTVWKAVKTTPAAVPRGKKTLGRIAKLEELLKVRASGATFQETQKILGISSSAFTRLISKLDMRRYEIFARAGDNRQKVIRLKAQIR
jgi:chromosome segregation ATPase